MSIPVRQSTAFECSIGPVLDADGVAVTDCVVGDFKLKKTTGNFAALNGSATLTHVSAGTYDLVLTTSDTDTVGLLTVAIDDTVNACAPVRMQVIEEAVYDALYAASANGFAGAAGASTVTFSNTSIATVTSVTNGVTVSTNNDKTGYGLADGAITDAKIAANAITDAKVASDVTIASVTGSVGSVTAGVTLANGAHGGAAASLTLKKIEVTAADSNASAVVLTGLGNGYGLECRGGAGASSVGIAASGELLDIDLDGTGTGDLATTSALSSLITTVGVAGAGLTAADDAVIAAIAALNNVSVTQIFTTAITEAYAADGAAPTLAQFISMLLSIHLEKSASGTTITFKKLDGSTTSMTATLDDATDPTSITRAT